MCATFAETEVISLLAQGAEQADIAASVHRAVAARTLGLLAQVGKRPPVVMTGGVAKNPAAVQFLSEALGLEVQVPSDPQISGAYGAALLALDEYRGRAAGDDRTLALTPAPVAPPDCRTCAANTEPTAPSQLLQITPLA